MFTLRGNAYFLIGVVSIFTPILLKDKVFQGVPVATQFLILGLWLGGFGVVMGLVKLAFDNHELRKQVAAEQQNTSRHTTMLFKLIVVFRIIYGVEANNHLFRQWYDALQSVNGGPWGLLKATEEQGGLIYPWYIPSLHTGSLDDTQRQLIRETLLGKERAKSSVR